MSMVQRLTNFHWCGGMAVLVAVVSLSLSGCGASQETTAPDSDAAAEHDHDHDHEGHDHDGHDHEGHDHADHHLGPNGGHFANLEPGDIKVEWVILDEGKELQVFVPAAAAEQVSGVEMHVQVGDDQLDPYSFTAAEDLGTGAWRLSDPALFSHVKMTADHDAGVTVEIVAATGDQPAKAKITHHQH